MQIYMKIFCYFIKSSTFAPTKLMTYTIRIIPLCKHSEWHASVALFLCISLEHILDKHTLSLPPKLQLYLMVINPPYILANLAILII